MNNVINKLKQLIFKRKAYALRLVDIEYDRRTKMPIALFQLQGEMLPVRIPCQHIFEKYRGYKKDICPEQLIILSKIYQKYLDQKFQVRVLEELQNNEFKIRHADTVLQMKGGDICKDMSLLESMNIKDAFRIIYNTAYRKAMADSKPTESAESYQSPVKLKIVRD